MEPNNCVEFLRAYVGEAPSRAQLRSYCTIGLRKGSALGRSCVVVWRTFLRHSVLAVEGDALFGRLVATAAAAPHEQQQQQPLLRLPPNARCIAIHYGTGEAGFPRLALRAVVAATTLSAGEPVVVCAASVARCCRGDEAAWYARRFRGGERLRDGDGDDDDDPAAPRAVRRWPAGEAFFHGVGARHARASAVVGFPLTLLELVECDATLGPGQLGIVARRPIPAGTCFPYTGPVSVIAAAAAASAATTAATVAVAAERDEDVYALGLGLRATCHGQGLARYINHRYNFCRFGNVELAALMVPVPTGYGKHAALAATATTTAAAVDAVAATGRLSSRVLDDDSAFVSLPFFIATTDIPAGAPVLARTYGEAYDARLERQAVCGGLLVPLRDAALLRPTLPATETPPLGHRRFHYDADHRWAVDAGELVWRRRRQHPQANALDIFVVVAVAFDVGVVLLRAASVVLADEGGDGPLVTFEVPFVAAASGPRKGDAPPLLPLQSADDVVAALDTVVLLHSGVDYRELDDGRLGAAGPASDADELGPPPRPKAVQVQRAAARKSQSRRLVRVDRRDMERRAALSLCAGRPFEPLLAGSLWPLLDIPACRRGRDPSEPELKRRRHERSNCLQQPQRVIDGAKLADPD